MGKWTAIPWADRTSNGQMGCAGCELSKLRGDGSCYAEFLINGMKRAGRKGYPEDFYKPALFTYRYDELLTLPDLVGVERPDKPWLNHLPQVIFHNDMGDIATPGLDVTWWHPWAARFAEMRALHIILTKWPARLRKSFEILGYVPSNFIVGVSVTGPRVEQRARELLRIRGARRWLSIEPDVAGVDPRRFWKDPGDGTQPFEWAVIGGQSGPEAQEYPIERAEMTLEACDELGVRPFMKQVGSRPTLGGKPYKVKDRKGEDWNEWPENIRRREMPLAA
jgi:protein gp37